MTVTAEEAEDAVKIILEYIENGGSGREGLRRLWTWG